MAELDRLARQFEAQRARLRAVALRMLGSSPEADDALQEAWLRVSLSDTDEVANLGGWLTTVVSRVCLDMLRSRRSRGEESLDGHEPEPSGSRRHEADPERDAVLADSVGMAMLVVLETLAPAERVAFVLHDMFDLSFDEIAPIIGRSSVATRQLASRARRRVRGTSLQPEADRTRQRKVVDAFLAASREGDLATLVSLLDPDVVVHSDAEGIKLGGPAELAGAAAVAASFKGRARAAVSGTIDGEVGVLVQVKGRMLVVLQLAFGDDGRIVAIDAVADRARLSEMQLTPFSAAGS